MRLTRRQGRGASLGAGLGVHFSPLFLLVLSKRISLAGGNQCCGAKVKIPRKSLLSKVHRRKVIDAGMRVSSGLGVHGAGRAVVFGLRAHDKPSLGSGHGQRGSRVSQTHPGLATDPGPADRGFALDSFNVL